MQNNPAEAVHILNRAINLRESLYRIIVTTLQGCHPNIGDIDLLNLELPEMLQRTALIHVGRKFEWGWEDGENEMDQMLWPILNSSSELLTTSDIEQRIIAQEYLVQLFIKTAVPSN